VTENKAMDFFTFLRRMFQGHIQVSETSMEWKQQSRRYMGLAEEVLGAGQTVEMRVTFMMTPAAYMDPMAHLAAGIDTELMAAIIKGAPKIGEQDDKT
jgi:hypothetical protein